MGVGGAHTNREHIAAVTPSSFLFLLSRCSDAILPDPHTHVPPSQAIVAVLAGWAHRLGGVALEQQASKRRQDSGEGGHGSDMLPGLLLLTPAPH